MATTLQKKPTIKKKPTPPKKLWKALRLGLDDLAKAEKSKRFEVYMEEWLTTNGKCRVCFAGSVMAFSLDGVKKCKKEGEDIWGVGRKAIGAYDFDGRWPSVFEALNSAREGNWADAWDHISGSDFDAPGVVYDLPYPAPYDEDPKQWRADMEKACAILKKAGI